MREQEAELEAARRNAEDERRDRFVFYALDHSAGMSDDAWEVEMRLRTRDDGPVPVAVPVAAARADRVEAAAEGEWLGATEALEAMGPAGLRDPVEPIEAVVAPASAPAVRATEVDEPPGPRRTRRRLRLLHVWAAFVILVGLLFIAATLLLAVGLRDYTHFGVIPTSVGIGLGLMAVWVGVALARTK